MSWLWIVLSGAVVFLVAAWAVFRIANQHALRLCRAISSAQPSYPVVGNTLLFACSLDKMTQRLKRILQQSVLNGDRALCFWIGAYPLVFVTDPKDIKTILNNSLSRGKEMEDSGREYSKYGLLTSPVDHWKVSRRQLELSFRPDNLQKLLPTFNNTSRRLVDDLSEHAEGAVFNLMPQVMSAGLRTICLFLYGPKAMENIGGELFDGLRRSVELVAEIAALRLTRPWLNISFVFRLLYWKEIHSIRKVFHEILQTGETNCKSTRETGKFKTVLDNMRALQQRVPSVTGQHVMDEMMSFFAAGTDTIGASVSSCLLALACIPHIQEKVYEEICSVVSEDYQDITHEELKRLTYLENVIKETLRFFMVLPFTSRAPEKDIDLGGYTIPANKLTILWLSSVAFDPKYFHDPYQFDPNRFLIPSSSDDVFIPFSRGPRNCIGKTYSMMLIKVMVIHVVRKYKLSTNMDIQNLKFKFTITLSSSEGYNVSLVNRRA